MARSPSPPDSPLSSMASSDAFDDETRDFDDNSSRPSKRLKVENGSRASSAVANEGDPDTEPVPEDVWENYPSVSSDTSGDIPLSPLNARLDEEDFQDQVTICDWDGCDAGDQGNMDNLVEHIHNSHIESRQKKYTCEWKSCNRKGMAHASGYALKAHMRSHTREKPFYCYLPECDRSFTRSDALAKHMRTVHETEALRPSDPVPKSMQAGPASKNNKLKIIIKTPQSHTNGQEDDSSGAGDANADYFTALTSELFSADELAFSVDKLYRKCHWESKWAGEVSDTLKKECELWEDVYYKEWLEKETLLAQVIKSEVDWHDRRAAILSGEADVDVTATTDAKANGVKPSTEVKPEGATSAAAA